MAELVLVKKSEGIATVSLNRPEAFNAFNFELIDLFANHMVTLASSPKIHGVIITGEGKSFCAGGDLKWALNFPLGAPAGFHELAARFHLAVLEIRRMAKPHLIRTFGVQ